MSLVGYLQLLVLAALWGASFLFMRTAAPEFGPIALIVLRTAVAALFLLLVMLVLARSQLQKLKRHWRPLLMLGLTNTALPFCFFAYATLYLEAGLTATINSTAPMFGALFAYFWLKQSLSKLAMLGLFLGFAGVYIMMSGKLSQDAAYLLPALIALTASACYGFSACYSSLHAAGLKPMLIAAGSQLYATFLLAVPAYFYWPTETPSVSAWLDVGYLGVGCTGIAYILYFRILNSDGVTKALSVTYLIPIFAFVWGWWFLKESVTSNVLIGAGTILLGVALTTGLIKGSKQQTAK